MSCTANILAKTKSSYFLLIIVNLVSLITLSITARLNFKFQQFTAKWQFNDCHFQCSYWWLVYLSVIFNKNFLKFLYNDYSEI